MKIRFLVLLSLLISLVPAAPSLAAGDRYALIIGNAKYPDADAPLKEPINDARDVADELKRDGFSVEIGENLTGDGMRAVKFAGAAVAAVIIVIALLLVVGVPSGFLTSTIASRVESATGYRLSIDGTTKISVWPTLNVTLNDLTLQDPKDRSGITRLTVDSVQADMPMPRA